MITRRASSSFSLPVSLSKVVVPAALAALTLLEGCGPWVMGQHRVVKKTPGAGEIALEGKREDAQRSADAYMASVCPGGYDVLEEGETVIGQDTNQNSQASRTFFGRPQTQTQSTSVDKTEWRIKYQCKSTNASGATPDAGPVPGGLKTSNSNAVHELVVRF